MSTETDTQTATDPVAGAGPNLYTFIAAQLRSQFVPGGTTEQVYQVTAQTVASGIYYFHNFSPKRYEQPGQVVTVLNLLAGLIEAWSAVPGVTGMSAVQVINAQDQFVSMFDVTVDSTSGNSSTVIRVAYPGVVVGEPGTQAFTDAVAQARATLDAVETA